MMLLPSPRSLGFAALLIVPTAGFANTWVITDSAHPVEVTEVVRVIHLAHLEVALSRGLPANPARAQALFQANMITEAATGIS
ncbi:DUF1525 domain-containing protein [Pseudomonas gingeri]|uniref:DUF1525 domain-containing protein n=1 Tax=Pseudomonas gingeri TaxID=117681 RepID=A0A7Y7XII8_9PSED|nr:DUF1525 domain-containing protein [Pseudomonas gingeri]NWB99493.1 DUF1525 domain-containing protein [Pseudomonas gingeri]